MKPLLVGEVNPLSDRPEHALYPWPPNCSGERLQRLVLGVSVHDYLRDFDRVDLCVGRWSAPAARAKAEELREPADRHIVMLGAKVFAAFAPGKKYAPFGYYGRGNGYCFVALSHPSGRCRAWQAPGSFERARKVLRDAGVLARET